MLTSAFKTLVNNPVKESFYGKKKYILIIFLFSIKIISKLFKNRLLINIKGHLLAFDIKKKKKKEEKKEKVFLESLLTKVYVDKNNKALNA